MNAADEFDHECMRRAIRLAVPGRGRVEPNPMVGCVIVHDGRTIGEGFHEQFGGPHAEPNALAACARAGEPTGGATAYVTLEPCCHTNKKTPPCVPLLIEAKVARVVVGCLDPNPEVNGKGIAELRSAGIDVKTGILEDQARQLIAPFAARSRLRRPYITLKWAESADGKVAAALGRPVRISNAASTRRVHELRARCDAILVGIGTVLADDPLLTARNVTTARPLRRIVLDSRLRIPVQSKLVQTAGDHPVIAYTSREANIDAAHASQLLTLGVQVHAAVPGAAGRPSLKYVVGHLDKGVTHLLVEPGPELARSFFRENLVDRVWVIRSPIRIENATAPSAAKVPDGYVTTGELELEGDRLTEYLNPTSAAFFSSDPSPDLEMTKQ